MLGTYSLQSESQIKPSWHAVGSDRWKVNTIACVADLHFAHRAKRLRPLVQQCSMPTP